METVFITIHDLSLDARIKYCSDSVEDVLGYLPYEVKGKSCWEYFHPDEIPFARAIHGRGISLDKAAVLNYCRVKHKDGSWVGCECVFTVVHDVLVASTSIYRRGPKARRRAIDGAGIRRIFSSSPRDPRYHMLSYISKQFYHVPDADWREPRAALFLNRFTRTSTIMFATNGVASILGLQPEDLVGKSFYYCISEGCLNDAVRCLESAKANDSIAYLRFWFRDPLHDDHRSREASMADLEDSDEDEGGVPLARTQRSESSMETSTPPVQPLATPIPHTNGDSTSGATLDHSLEAPRLQSRHEGGASNSRSSSGISTDLDGNASDAIFDHPITNRSDSASTPPEESESSAPVEIEAVVSCTSDGLVVVLRRARTLIPRTPSAADTPDYDNGLFASPWAAEPIMPTESQQAAATPANSCFADQPVEAGFMNAIREVAVFTWSLTGINGSLAQYGHGTPTGEAQPPGGLPVWDPNSNADTGDRYNGFSGSAHRPVEGMCEPMCKKDDEGSTSSEDEVLWKRVPQMPEYRRPKRRAHEADFGADGVDGAAVDRDDRASQTRRRKY